MGYYIETHDQNIFLDKKHFEDVYKKMCELNDYHDLKSGGSYGNNNDAVEGDRYPRDKWFAWMAYNYPEIYSDMHSILEALGFDVEYDADGNLINLSYWNKTGSEDYFFSCFAGFVKDGNFICIKGEESEDYYRYFFKDGKMIKQYGTMIVSYETDGETYEFGQPSESDKAFAEWKKNLNAAREAEKAENN